MNAAPTGINPIVETFVGAALMPPGSSLSPLNRHCEGPQGPWQSPDCHREPPLVAGSVLPQPRGALATCWDVAISPPGGGALTRGAQLSTAKITPKTRLDPYALCRGGPDGKEWAAYMPPLRVLKGSYVGAVRERPGSPVGGSRAAPTSNTPKPALPTLHGQPVGSPVPPVARKRRAVYRRFGDVVRGLPRPSTTASQ